MRFRFCGDLDCPDWVLAEINTLSKMSSIKVKMLCQIVATFHCSKTFDDAKATKLVSDAKLTVDDMKACVAALSQIFVSATRYGVEEEILNSELQQLGLPKEHSTALCKIYKENLSLFTQDLAKKSFRTTTLEDVSCDIRDFGLRKIDFGIQLNDRLQDSTTKDVVLMSGEQLMLLLSDLKLAREEMKTLPR